MRGRVWQEKDRERISDMAFMYIVFFLDRLGIDFCFIFLQAAAVKICQIQFHTGFIGQDVEKISFMK